MTGLNLELEKLHISPDDWVFGIMSDPCIADIPNDVREDYLPKGEVQRGKEDFMDCATRAPINEMETKFNWLLRTNKLLPENKQWLLDNGYISGNSIEFSDRYISVLSGTTREGNSMITPLQTIHTYGLIPKKLLPKEDWMTFDDYQDKTKVTNDLVKLGQEFIKRFTINYERVYAVHFSDLLKEDMIIVTGHAWGIPIGNVFPKNDGPINHCFLQIKKPDYAIFDNYFDPTDGDFIKQLAPDFTFGEYGYRVYISSQQLPTKNWFEVLLDWLFSRPVTNYVFNFDLKNGVHNPDVIGLQKLLNSDPDTQLIDIGPGSKGHETDYFGWLTTNALLKFQKKHNLPATGKFDTITRKFINEKIYMDTPSETLYKTAKSLIGQNLAPGNEMLGCAISVSAVYNKAFPANPPVRFASTTEWFDYLRNNSLWVNVREPEPECIIVSPTGQIPANSPLQHGHIGIIGKLNADDGSLYIMSNNSLEGIWDVNFTVKKWADYYQKYGQIPTYYYKLM
jgi:hypothetical protein